MSGRRTPRVMAHTNTAMNPLPCGGSVVRPYVRKAMPSAYSARWWAGIDSFRGPPRGSRTDASSPIATPYANPSVTSWSTKCHHTKSSSPTSSAAISASTGGSARPSLSPDSRLSEWRIRRGTRGLVTTLEDSTGSVGDSSAPSRNASVHDRSVSAAAVTATIAAVMGIASTSLRSGRCHSRRSISPSTSSPSRNRITTSATTASTDTKPPVASKRRTSRPPWPSTTPTSTNRAVSETKLRRAIPDTSAPPTRSAPSTVSAVSVEVMGIQFQTFHEQERRVHITVLGKSPAWQDADGACSGYLVEEDGACLLLDCGNSVFSKLRRYRDYTDVDAVVISHLHADHFLDLVPFTYALIYAPRQQPVPVDRWPGTATPARPRLIAPQGATEVFRRVVGSWGPEDLIDNA